MKRAILATLLSGGLGLMSIGSLQAQGVIVPRPCVRPCTVTPVVERVASAVRVEVTGRVLQFEITETFRNRGSALAEADYIFPLPTGAAFQDLKLSINGEMVAGEIMDANRARAIYEQIVRQQRDPALVEWMGSGMLRTRVFPIGAGEQRTIVLRYQTVAQREGDAIRVDYRRSSPSAPGWIGRPVPLPRPMRMPHPGQERKADTANRTVHEASFEVSYPADATYGRAYSPTHAVDINRRGNRNQVVLKGDGANVTLMIPVHASAELGVTALTHAPANSNGFVMVTVSPPRTALAVTPRDVTVVLDVSGSMSGKKIEQAKAAARQVLNTLRPADRFRLIDFASHVNTFQKEFVAATPANRDRAGKYIDKLEAIGGTNIAGALEEALAATSESSRLPIVLFVTDGEPTVGESNPDKLAQLAADKRGRARLFTFGLGADVNVMLVEQMAIEGRGTAHFVRPEESVEYAVAVVASRLTTPVLTNVRLRATGSNDFRLVQMLPSAPADLFAGQELVFFARYDGSGNVQVVVEGESPSGAVRHAVRVHFPEQSRDNAFVARLWAAQRIGYLSAERRKRGASPELDGEIKTLGETYGIPTEFTSYFVPEPGLDVNDVRVMHLRTAPQGSPARTMAFEKARDAAGLRSATSMSMADTIAVRGRSRSETRRVGARIYILADSVWTDTRPAEQRSKVSVVPYSEAYFALIAAIPELAEHFGVGERMIIVGRDIVIELAPQGVTQLSAARITEIRKQW